MPDPTGATQLQKRAIITDAAIDAITGDLFLLDSDQQTMRATVKGIRDSLERMHGDFFKYDVPSLYDLGVRPEVLDAD